MWDELTTVSINNRVLHVLSMTKTEQVAQTVVLDLETSNRKNNKIQKAIDEYQEMSKYISDMITSFEEYKWSTMNPQFYRLIQKEYGDDRYIASTVALESIEDVVGGYKSWKSNGKQGHKPVFGNSNYVRCKSDQITIEGNNKGYGIKFNIVPYKPEWFHIDESEFSEKYLKKIINDNASFGTCEIHKQEDRLKAHLVVTWEVDVLEKKNADTVVGVDLGESVIYTYSVLSSEGFEDVQLKDGDEFRHHRERLKEKKSEMMKKDNLRGVKQCRNQHENYTEQVLHTASKKIVKEATKHPNPMIVLEDLTNYRKTASNAIHDWPYALCQEMIMYKAKAKGIPVEVVDPRNTSKTCRNCGFVHSSNRNGSDFECSECGYEVHADVNASMNIALRGSDFNREEFGINRESTISSDGTHDSVFQY
jgi:IS605 OrfB family transposase